MAPDVTTGGDVGLVGLGVMGRNLALNLADHGRHVFAHDADANARTDSKPDHTSITICDSVAALAACLQPPRVVVLLVPAGQAVDTAAEALAPHLAAGDVVIDGGNSHWRDTERRQAAREAFGILWLGAGISGGADGARHGPSIMVGGPLDGWRRVGPVLEAVAAHVDGNKCCAWLGDGGAGHFVKMLHNGIEYAELQLIAEVVLLLQRRLGADAYAASVAFESWGDGPLASYLIDIAAEVMGTVDPETDKPLVQLIVDCASEKGTGRWAAEAALDLGVAAPTIAEAVAARAVSVQREHRQTLSKSIAGPTGATQVDAATWLPLLHDALLAGRLAAYAQGFAVLAAARRVHGWRMDLAGVAELWRGGCIIRARVLDDVAAAYRALPDLENLLLAEDYRTRLTSVLPALRGVVAMATTHGLPIPALASTLSYLDGLRTARLSANVIEALRDRFGGHGFARIDRPGRMSFSWPRGDRT